jgi:hypothetical protein
MPAFRLQVAQMQLTTLSSEALFNSKVERIIIIKPDVSSSKLKWLNFHTAPYVRKLVYDASFQSDFP